MTNFSIKIIALLTMTIDHIGYILFPEQIIFRIIGRISFILFAFLIVEGTLKTKSKKRYFLSLFIFANIIQFFSLLPSINFPVNVFFTLSMGSLIIIGFEKYRPIYSFGIMVMGILFVDIINSDYSIYGVIVILLFYILQKYKISILVAFIVLPIITYYFIITTTLAQIQLYCVFALIILIFYNGKRGYYNTKLKYLVYLYYPLHLVFLEMLKMFQK